MDENQDYDYLATTANSALETAQETQASANLDTTGASTGQIAIFNGSIFVPAAVTSGDGIGAAYSYSPSYALTFSVTNAATLRTALSIDAIATKKSNLSAAVAPTVNEDSGDGYDTGSLWIDTTADNIYMATDVTVGAAIWRQLN